ncbi:MAG: ZIP family metal transporter [Peptococcaceae bacterium]|nr:ZIP family metal transporter [Peptococcaceae bacterium]
MTSIILFESLAAGIATLLGAAMVCSFGRPRARLLAGFMGFAGGVMACVVIFDLLPYSYSFGSLLYTFSGFWLGVILMQMLETGVGGLARRKLAAREKKARQQEEKKKAREAWEARPRGLPSRQEILNSRRKTPAVAGAGNELWVSPSYRKSGGSRSRAPAAAAASGQTAEALDAGAAAKASENPSGDPSFGLSENFPGSPADLADLTQEGPLGLAAAAAESAALLAEAAAEPDKPVPFDFKANASRYFQLGLLVAIGIALHDLPEGMAIAAGHTVRSETGVMLALAIGLHNIPEGIASATPFVMAGVKRRWILLAMLLISFFTPLGAWLGLLLLNLGPQLISILLSLAGGAMISLVIREMIPEAWAINKLTSFLGFLAGCGLLGFMTFYLHH